MIKIHRHITSLEVDTYTLYVKRFAMDGVLEFGVYLYDDQRKNVIIDNPIKVDGAAVRHCFAVSFNDVDKKEYWEEHLWKMMIGDLEKCLESSKIEMNNGYKRFWVDIIDRETMVIKELKKRLYRKNKINRLLYES